MFSKDIDALRTLALNRLRRRHKIPADDREDIVQDSLIELARVAPREPEAMLRTIIDRRAIDFLRRQATRRAVEVPAGDIPSLEEYETLVPIDEDDNLFTASFDLALRNLPTEQRDAFILMDLRGLTAREAAAELGVPKSTVARRVAEARVTIRKEVHRG